MSEQRIENHISNVLAGDAQKLALDFVTCLGAQEMQFERGTGYWDDKRYWMIKYKDEYVCFILVNGYGCIRHKDEPEGWNIWSDDSGGDWFAHSSPDEQMKEIAWENVDYCGHCGGICDGGTHKTIFGKEFDNVCRTTFRFDNPNAEAVECAKRLVNLRKIDIKAASGFALMEGIKIKKLTPDLAEDYAHFFDVTPHDVNIDEQKCYCATWRSDGSYAHGETHWFPTREERRTRAIGFVRDGSLQGYLAYCGDKIIGWCNANADCQCGVNYLRSYWPIEEYPEGIKVKSIFCFMIAPEMQRKGVATQLVERVCEDAADDGFDYVEAYINKEFVEADHDCRGPLKMYEKCGFIKYAEREGKVVVRKALK